MKKKFASLRERRKYRRLSKSFGVNIVSVGKKTTLPKLDHEIGLNISLGGLLIKCERFLKKNTALGLTLMLVKRDAYKTITTTGRIVWSRASFDEPPAFFMGIAFKKLTPQDKKSVLWFFK